MLLFEDESMIRDYQAIGYNWFEKGKQRIVPTYGKHEGVKLLGVLDYASGEVFVCEYAKYDAAVFLEFLKRVLDRYPGKRIEMILDNAGSIMQN
ncbi:MAG: transposase [Bacillota bacterium]